MQIFVATHVETVSERYEVTRTEFEVIDLVNPEEVEQYINDWRQLQFSHGYKQAEDFVTFKPRREEDDTKTRISLRLKEFDHDV